MYKFAFYLLGLLFSPIFLYAQQQKVTYPHRALWTKFELAEIGEKGWGGGIDVIYRTNNTLDQGIVFDAPHRLSIRPWIHKQFGKDVRVSLSPIAYFWTQEYFAKEEDFDRTPYDELRTTLQVIHHHKTMGERFTHTFRHWFEVRYRNPFEDNYFLFTRYRIRYRLRYLLNKDYYSQKGVWYTYASNEVMVNYGQSIVYNMFSQNRIQLAVGYRFMPAVRVELRYMNRYRSRPSGFEYDNTQAVFIGLFIDQFSKIYKKDVRPVKFFD